MCLNKINKGETQIMKSNFSVLLAAKNEMANN